MRFRRIRPEDVRALAKLNSEIFGDTTPAMAASVFRDSLSRAIAGGCLVAVEDGGIAGAVITSREITFQGPGAHIRSLFVAGSRRGEGIGKALLFRAVSAARKAGCRSLSLTVEPGNRGAISLYEKAGFRRTRLRYSKRL